MQEQTDLPLLVRTDTGRFLRQPDIQAGGRDDQFYFFDTKAGAIAEAPRGTLALDGGRAGSGGPLLGHLADGSQVEVVPVFQVLKERLADYEPEKAAALCGVHPGVIRTLAQKVARKRTNILLGFNAGKYYHGDLMERSMCLLLALTGNWGKKGTGTRNWSVGMFDGAYLSSMKTKAGQDEAKNVVNMRTMMTQAMKAQDPTMTEEMAAFELMRMAAPMGNTVPPAFFWYYHCGYRDRWNRPEWSDPAMGAASTSGPARRWTRAGGAAWSARPPNAAASARRGRREPLATHAGRAGAAAGKPLAKAEDGCHGRLAHADHRHVVRHLPAGGHELREGQLPHPNAPHHEPHLLRRGGGAPRRGQARMGDRPLAGPEAGGAGRSPRPTECRDGRGGVHRLDKLVETFTLGGAFAQPEELADEWVRDTAALGNLPEGTNLETMREKGFVRFIDWGVVPFTLAQASDLRPDETHNPFRWHTEKKMPYPTLTRRAQFYIDHDWFLQAGEELPVHKANPRMGGDYPLVPDQRPRPLEHPLRQRCEPPDAGDAPGPPLRPAEPPRRRRPPD